MLAPIVFFRPLNNRIDEQSNATNCVNFTFIFSHISLSKTLTDCEIPGLPGIDDVNKNLEDPDLVGF